jgi:hypothetical protein
MVEDELSNANQDLSPNNPINDLTKLTNLAQNRVVPGINSIRDLNTGYLIPTTPVNPMQYEEGNDYEIPTSTENPQRPRTVAAYYSSVNQVLTVVFRLDRGKNITFYNYYKVDSTEWNNFKAAPSKGKYILRVLDSKPRGIADTSNLPPEFMQEAYEAGRYAQLVENSNKGFKPKPQKPRGPRRTSGKPTTEINFGKSGKILF